MRSGVGEPWGVERFLLQSDRQGGGSVTTHQRDGITEEALLVRIESTAWILTASDVNSAPGLSPAITQTPRANTFIELPTCATSGRAVIASGSRVPTVSNRGPMMMKSSSERLFQRHGACSVSAGNGCCVLGKAMRH